MKNNTIYLDHAATTKVSDAASDKALEIMRECYGNPSSAHHMGLWADEELLRARHVAASVFGAPLSEYRVVFTSGGTEANNLAIFGGANANRRKGDTIVTTKAEHSSVYQAVKELCAQGFRVEHIPVRNGELDLCAAEKILCDRVSMISVMLVNNETGAVFDVAALDLLRKRLCPNAYLHTDAVQAFSKIPLSIAATNADLISVSGHKIFAPKGVGALYIKKGVRVTSRLFGGGQEDDLRSGTEALPQICAFSVAARQASDYLEQNYAHAKRLYRHLEDTLRTVCPEARMTVPKVFSPYIASVIIPNIRSEIMLRYLSGKGICVSAGSACSAKRSDNRVLMAHGVRADDADSTLRVSFAAENTCGQIDILVSCLRRGMDTLIPVKFYKGKP